MKAIDLGRPVDIKGAGEGEGESLEKGLLRHLGPFVVGADMFAPLVTDKRTVECN